MRKRLWLLISFLLAISMSLAGVALAQQTTQQQEAQPGPQQQQVQEDESKLEDDGIIDSAAEVHAAHPDEQHGGRAGHLPPTQKNVRLVGKAAVKGAAEGRIADVGAFKDHAYLAAFREPNCRNGGVYVLNIRNLQKPRQVGFIKTAEGSFVGEGVQVKRITTPEFEGDLLVHNNEVCRTPEQDVPDGGISLVNVTNPERPRHLARGVGDFEPEGVNGPEVAHQVHSAFIWDAGRKAYAVLVDDEETADVDIMDITDPRNPKLIKEYDLNEDFPQIVQQDLGGAGSFLHDMVVEKIGGRFVMLLSYWDGGYVKLDVTKPRNATYIADSDFNNPDPEAAESGFAVEPEGNAHQAELSSKNNFIVAADEDFSPYGILATNTSDNTEFDATQGSDTPQIDADTSIEGQTVFVGRACDIDPAVPAGDGTQIAVVERGACTFTEKVANVEAAGGYVGVIVFNSQVSAGGSCTGLITMSVEGNIPALFVGRDTGFDLFDQVYNDADCQDGDPATGALDVPIGTAGDNVVVEAFFNGWGYVHLFKNGSGKLRELDTYAIHEAHDPRFAEGFGDLSVHEVAMSRKRNDLAYFSYYAGGFRVTQIRNNKLVEVGSFIDRGGNNFWGVQVIQRDGREYVLASDRDFGLYVFKFNGRR